MQKRLLADPFPIWEVVSLAASFSMSHNPPPTLQDIQKIAARETNLEGTFFLLGEDFVSKHVRQKTQ